MGIPTLVCVAREVLARRPQGIHRVGQRVEAERVVRVWMGPVGAAEVLERVREPLVLFGLGAAGTAPARRGGPGPQARLRVPR